jgi:O-antigen/teichoic acid export membrane protein
MGLWRNTLWNLAGTGLPLLLGAFTIPYLLTSIGVEAFGLLTLIWALIGYFSLFDFGLGRALTQQVASARSAGLSSELSSLVKAGLWLTVCTGIAGGVILASLADTLAHDWLNVSIPLQSSTLQALFIAALGIPLTTVTTGLRGILEGYEEFKFVNVLRIGLGAANFGLPALSVLFISHSLTWMVASLIAARAAVLLAHGWLVYWKLSAERRSAPITAENLRRLLSFGAWMTMSNVIGPLMVTADRFVISAVLGASVVAYYTVPFEVIVRILVIPAALTSALFPRLASLMRSDSSEAKRVYSKCLKVVTFALTPICLLIATGSKFGMTLWLGEEFAEHSWAIVSVMAIGLMLNGIAHVPFAAIQAAGNARITALLHIIEFALYVPVLLLSIHYFDLLGAAFAWTIRVGLDLVGLILYAKKVRAR